MSDYPPTVTVPRRRFVLMVEDNPNDEALAMRALRRAGLASRVEIARDGAEALEFLFATGRYCHRDPGDLPVVVLLDINLPRISGLGVLARLRDAAATADLPVVMFTSSDVPQDMEESSRLRANSFIRKPVEFASFTYTVIRTVDAWLAVADGQHPAGGGGPSVSSGDDFSTGK